MKSILFIMAVLLGLMVAARAEEDYRCYQCEESSVDYYRRMHRQNMRDLEENRRPIDEHRKPKR